MAKGRNGKKVDDGFHAADKEPEYKAGHQGSGDGKKLVPPQGGSGTAPPQQGKGSDKEGNDAKQGDKK